MNIRPIIAYLLCAASMSATVGFAADQIRVVAMTGQQAPGFPEGVSFGFNGILTTGATINASGELTFDANLTGLGIDQSNNNTVWVGTPENLQLLAQEGQPAPGTEPGTVFDAFNPVGGFEFKSPIAPNGEVAFRALVRGPGVVSNNNRSGIWAGTPGNLQLIARQGDPAPGTEAGTVFNEIDQVFAYNDGGAAFYASLRGPSVDGSNDYGIWSGRANNVQLVVREASVAPDLPAGSTVNAGGIATVGGPISINSQGKVAFLAVTSTLTDANRTTVYAGAPGAVKVIARAGQPAPGVPGATFRLFSRNPFPTVNDVGQVSFYDPLTPPSGGGLIPSLWVGTATSLTPAIVSGSPVPSPLPPGTVFDDLGGIGHKHLQNAVGSLAVVATVNGPDVTRANDFVLLTGTQGDLKVLARESDPAPGTGAGEVYQGPLGAPFINSSGEVAFSSSLDDGSTSGTLGIWIMKPGTPPRLVVRNNDSFDAGGGNIVTVNNIDELHYNYSVQSVSSGNQDGRPSAFSDNGQLVFGAVLTGIGQSILIADPLDTDNDGVRDNLDNCIEQPNADQRDSDLDGFGNRCDADIALPNDNVVNLSDFSKFRAAFGSTAPLTTAQEDADFNGDGTVNLSDFSIFRSNFGRAPGPSCCGIPQP